MPKYIYSIANSDGEDAGELEIEARNELEAASKARQEEKARSVLKPGEYLFEWREVPEAPSGIRRK